MTFSDAGFLGVLRVKTSSVQAASHYLRWPVTKLASCDLLVFSGQTNILASAYMRPLKSLHAAHLPGDLPQILSPSLILTQLYYLLRFWCWFYIPTFAAPHPPCRHLKLYHYIYLHTTDHLSQKHDDPIFHQNILSA